MPQSDRHERGLEVLRQVGGPDYDAPINALSEIAPDLGRFTVDFGYGEVMARPGLDLRTRQLCTVAALAALGTAQPQLHYHIDGARNVGCSPQEIIETLLLVTVFAGFPAALNAVTAARAVFERRGDSVGDAADDDGEDAATNDRFERGSRALEEISGGSGREVVDQLADIAPHLGRFIIEFSYGDVIGRAGLEDRTKELATVAMCTALGTVQPQLGVHIAAALNVGATRDEIVEVITQMAIYAGFPAALNGISVARGVFEEAG